MKKILFAILAGAFLSGNAQITITSADAPQAGDVFYNANDTGITQTINPGPVGENVTWDFSMLGNAFTDTTTFVEASTIPQSVDFPDANLAELTSQDTSFLKTTSSEITFLGVLSGGMEMKLDNPLIGMKYPYTYGTTFSDTGHFSVTMPYDTTVQSIHIDSVKFDKTINSTDSCIAYGQLILPNETFNNVLINKNTSVNHDIVSVHTDLMGWVDAQDTQYTTISYSVYTNGYGQPLLTLNLNNDGTVKSATYKYSEASFVSTMPAINIKLYPNPAHKNITVTLPGSKADISIVDDNGQLVINKQFTSKKIDIDIESLPVGNYLIKVKTPRGTAIKKFIKE